MQPPTGGGMKRNRREGGKKEESSEEEGEKQITRKKYFQSFKWVSAEEVLGNTVNCLINHLNICDLPVWRFLLL
jgi:hypothetical protein